MIIQTNKLKLIAKSENKDIATVYVAEINNKKLEFVESVQPPFPIGKKWVLIVSTLCGCPVNCMICDAGGNYNGKLSKEEILMQIDFMVKNRWNSKVIPTEKFKIQFARVGEPAFNLEVLKVLEELPDLYKTPCLLPSISTIAPEGTDDFFEGLLEVKNRLYKENFQMQFSIHNTDTAIRNRLIPTKKWSFDKINSYSEKFFNLGDRKICLNFAISNTESIDTNVLSAHFNPEIFAVKITGINPTFKSQLNNLYKEMDINSIKDVLIPQIKTFGFDVILSLGELEENSIGSNCGQYIGILERNKPILGYENKLNAVF
ncbi:MAG: radical SAM protein [Bacteroidota bacterium]